MVVDQVEDKVGLGGGFWVSIDGVRGDALTTVARTVEVLGSNRRSLVLVMRGVSRVVRGNWLSSLRVWSPWVGMLGSLWLLGLLIPRTWVCWIGIRIMRCLLNILCLI